MGARSCDGAAPGLAQAEIEDVSQAVLTELVVRLRRFTYDPAQSFRGFLHKVVNDAVLDAFAARKRKIARGGSEGLELLASAEARSDLARRLEEEYDLELLEEATRRVRRRVLPQTWEAYRLTAEEGLSARDRKPSKYAGRGRVCCEGVRITDVAGRNSRAGIRRLVVGTRMKTARRRSVEV